jgi:ElaB/YqjD/DUF883 family membrane-anchored ribosome-binding protein
MNTHDTSMQPAISSDPPPQELAAAIQAGLRETRREAAALVDHAGETAGALAQRGARALRDTSQGLRDSALRAGDSTVLYIKDEPLKAVLIAAATGAALMALVGLLTRSRHRA